MSPSRTAFFVALFILVLVFLGIMRSDILDSLRETRHVMAESKDFYTSKWIDSEGVEQTRTVYKDPAWDEETFTRTWRNRVDAAKREVEEEIKARKEGH